MSNPRNDFWIVSGYPFFEHKSAAGAVTEARRLSKKEGGKAFHIYRVSETLAPVGASGPRHSRQSDRTAAAESPSADSKVQP